MPREQVGTKDSCCRGLEEHQHSASGNVCGLQASGCNSPKKKDLQSNFESDNWIDDHIGLISYFFHIKWWNFYTVGYKYPQIVVESVLLKHSRVFPICCDGVFVFLHNIFFIWLQSLSGSVHTGIQELGHSLIIENTMLFHEGQYTCVVTNSAGEDKRDFLVTIQGVFAECVCLSLLRNVNIKSDLRFWYVDNREGFTTLKICRARGLFSPVPPVFHRVTNREAAWGLGHESDDKEDMVERLDVVLGHPVSLSCESNAIPPPKLSWHKDGRKLVPGDGVVLLPGRTTLSRSICCVLLLCESYLIRVPSQADRCCKLLECRRRMLEGTRARLLMKQERTTCTLNCTS